MCQKQGVYSLRETNVNCEAIDRTRVSRIGSRRDSIIHLRASKEMDQSELNTLNISKSLNLLEKNSCDDVEQPSAIKFWDSLWKISEESVRTESNKPNEKSPGIPLCLSLSETEESHDNSSSVFPPDVNVFRPRKSSLWGVDQFWRSSTLVIDTKTLLASSFAGEVRSSIKLNSLMILCFLVGVGYQGRLTISKWFGVLETIHHWPVAIGIAAFADSICIISNWRLYKIFTIGLFLVFYTDLIFFVMFADVLYGHLMNSLIMGIYVLLVYAYCSKGLYVRVIYVFLYIVGYSLLSIAILIMLYFELWTGILLAIIPTDLIMNMIVVWATKTCDCLSYLQVNAMIYCALFENVRYLSMLGIIDDEMDYTINLAKFAAIDVLCIFISKSEIVSYINFHTQWCGQESKTWLLAGRITRSCVNVTTLSWPIWNIGYELGRILMNPDGNTAAFATKIELLVVLNYVPELLGEIALFIYLKCLPAGKYKHERLNFMWSLLSFFYLAAYGMIPGVFLCLRILIA